MMRWMAKSKIHRATVTEACLDYEGSIAVDPMLLEAADIKEFEKIELYNINNGERFSTYAIRADEGSGIISINGAAAHRAQPGDIIIIAAYGVFNEAEAIEHKPQLCYVDRHNHLTHTNRTIPKQAA